MNVILSTFQSLGSPRAAWLALALSSSALAQHYNMSAEFSRNNNPTGPWAYRIAGSPIACTIHGGDLWGWGCIGSFDASITTIVQPPVIIPVHDALKDDVVIHVSSEESPGPMSITWTAPKAGTITVTGLAWDAAFYPDRDAGWTLLLNDVTLATRASVVGLYRTDAAASFANNLVPGPGIADLAVAQGDVVTLTTFRVTTYGHFMGVKFAVAYATCPADFDGDGSVDFFDYDAFVTCFEGGTCPPETTADFDHDGTVDFFDYDAFVAAFESPC